MGDNILKTKEDIEKIYKCLLYSNNYDIINNIKGMNKKKAEEITKKYKAKKEIKNYPKNRLCFCEFFIALFSLIFCFSNIFFSLILFYYDLNSIDYVGKAYERYNDIKNVSGEYLSIIYKNKSLINNTKFIDLFHLSFFKFANFAYNQKISEDNFMNWKIINKFSLSKYNYFYVLEDEINKKIIVTFPGTIDGQQLFEEVLGSSLQKFNESHKEILICDYFGKRTLKIIDYILNEKVKKLIDNGYQVISTGHSLGGAMAQTFMYFALIQNRIKKNNYPMIITFCQPKVGNIFFADYIDKNTFSLRFLNGKDIVPSIPKFSYNFFSFFKYIIRYDLNSCQYKHTKEEKNMIILDEGITLGQIFKFFLLFIIFVICIISFYCVIYYLKKEYILNYDFGMIKIFYYNLNYNIIALSFFICIIAIVLFYLKNVFKVIWIWGAYKTLIVLIFFYF